MVAQGVDAAEIKIPDALEEIRALPEATRSEFDLTADFIDFDGDAQCSTDHSFTPHEIFEDLLQEIRKESGVEETEPDGENLDISTVASTADSVAAFDSWQEMEVAANRMLKFLCTSAPDSCLVKDLVAVEQKILQESARTI